MHLDEVGGKHPSSEALSVSRICHPVQKRGTDTKVAARLVEWEDAMSSATSKCKQPSKEKKVRKL